MEIGVEDQHQQRFGLVEGLQEIPPERWQIPGFRASGVHAGLKRRRRDVALIVSEEPAIAVGTFTTNQVQAAPVRWTRRRIEVGLPVRAIVCNSGNANACNGPQGEQDAAAMAAATAAALGISPDEVLVASTGVIGLPLDMGRLLPAIGAAAAALESGPDGWSAAVEGIMTTDTRPKMAAVECAIQGRTVHVAGIAKGSGMIHPNMATMLAFVVSDGQAERAVLQDLWRQVVGETFNQISVDGDTSTNDMALLLAGGRSGVRLDAGDPELKRFAAALHTVARSLARQIASDGEGATHLVEVEVTRASSDAAARQIARSIARSNLVKAAVFGQDANWGRILCAAGYAGVPFDPEKVNIWIGPVQVCQNGRSLPFDEAAASAALAQPEVHLAVDLAAGNGTGVAWGCDLTYDYVKINANYRT
ncbi:MAG: bifunctional glutamate N-acetyltransferase/amino-acid acetyltransferase ArgJ [Limnochordaceae bacterium]|nr:bifunctional glutamate N-acetyltransferase/amino-acid acetyltransferase ArgJ [Limnochordaceae bacterium]